MTIQTVGELKAWLSGWEDHAFIIVHVPEDDDVRMVESLESLRRDGFPLPPDDPQYACQIVINKEMK